MFLITNKNIDSKVDNLFNKFSIKNKESCFLGSDKDLEDSLIYEVNVTKKIEEVIQTTFEYKNPKMFL